MYIRSIAIDKKIGSRGGTYTVCTQFTHASLGTYSPTVCASPLFFQLLLKKVATEPQHYFSAQNECASVLNGTHLFPLQVLRQRCYPPACRITTLYYTPAGRERVGLQLLKPPSTWCNLILWPVGVAVAVVKDTPGNNVPALPRTQTHKHTYCTMWLTHIVCRARPHSFSLPSLPHICNPAHRTRLHLLCHLVPILFFFQHLLSHLPFFCVDPAIFAGLTKYVTQEKLAALHVAGPVRENAAGVLQPDVSVAAELRHLHCCFTKG